MWRVDLDGSLDLSLERLHKHGIVGKLFHVDLFDGHELSSLFVLHFEDFTIWTLTEELSLWPIISIGKGKLIITLHLDDRSKINKSLINSFVHQYK